MDARVNLNFRARPASVKWLDETAEVTGHSRSDVLRVALSVARRHEAELKAALADDT